MAGDYIPFDHDFPEKPETLAIYEATGVPIGEIMLRLHRFWRTVDRQTDNGVLRGVGIRSLALICGGDEAFWEAVREVGWLKIEDNFVVMPGFKERLGGRRGSARQRLKWAQKKRRQRERQRGDMSPLSPGTAGGQMGRQAPNQNQNQNQNHNQEPESVSEPESEPQETLDVASTTSCSDLKSEPLSSYVFPTVGCSKTWTLPESKLAEYRASFPDLDVEAEIRAARQWCRDNQPKRKTPGGMPRFLSAWLARAQNRGQAGKGAGDPRGTAAAVRRFQERLKHGQD